MLNSIVGAGVLSLSAGVGAMCQCFFEDRDVTKNNLDPIRNMERFENLRDQFLLQITKSHVTLI